MPPARQHFTASGDKSARTPRKRHARPHAYTQATGCASLHRRARRCEVGRMRDAAARVGLTGGVDDNRGDGTRTMTMITKDTLLLPFEACSFDNARRARDSSRDSRRTSGPRGRSPFASERSRKDSPHVTRHRRDTARMSRYELHLKDACLGDGAERARDASIYY